MVLAGIIGAAAPVARAQIVEGVPVEPQAGVVTGSVQARRLGDAPFAISAVSAEEMRSAGPMINLSEALARVPGLVAANRNNYTQDLQISSRGFESPQLGELAYQPDGQAGFNLGLKGQTSRQVELGSKWRVDGLEVDAAVFAAHTDNEIAVQTNNGGRSAFQNVGRTSRQGLELSARWRPTTTWRLQAVATWLEATYEDGFLTCTAAPWPTTPMPTAPRAMPRPTCAGWPHSL